jgi:predicted RNase H-like HicB family nuclease
MQQVIDSNSFKVSGIENYRGDVCECRAAFILDEVEGGFTVVARNLPGVVSEGENMESAIANITDAFREMILSHRDCKQDIPWVDGEVEVSGNVTVELRLLVKL